MEIVQKATIFSTERIKEQNKYLCLDCLECVSEQVDANRHQAFNLNAEMYALSHLLDWFH